MKTGSKEKELFLKLCRYCAYQERAISEVKEKMDGLAIDLSMQTRLIDALIAENFINEKRFAASFTRGKFRNNGWGRLKIKHALNSKGLSAGAVAYGFEQLSTDEYISVLGELMEAKMRRVKKTNLLARRKIVADYLCRKGFEPSLVWDLLKAKYPG